MLGQQTILFYHSLYLSPFKKEEKCQTQPFQYTDEWIILCGIWILVLMTLLIWKCFLFSLDIVLGVKLEELLPRKRQSFFAFWNQIKEKAIEIRIKIKINSLPTLIDWHLWVISLLAKILEDLVFRRHRRNLMHLSIRINVMETKSSQEWVLQYTFFYIWFPDVYKKGVTDCL